MSDEERAKPTVVEWGEFIVETPPLTTCLVRALGKHLGKGWDLEVPEIEARCDRCDGIRRFDPYEPRMTVQPQSGFNWLIGYQCRDCRSFQRVFALHTDQVVFEDVNISIGAFSLMRDHAAVLRVAKFGQIPPFGDPLSTRVFRLVGDDREMLLKGRRCENQGLGIAAFAYYRRVVERNLQRMLDEIRKTAVELQAPKGIIDAIDAAGLEQQFSARLQRIRDAVPESLFIGGQNPMGVLYRTLSEGIHEDDDAECLERAAAVRTVLVAFAEHMRVVVRDRRALADAMTRLGRKGARRRASD